VKPPVIGQGPGGTDYTYENKPVVFVSSYDAIRFANWLHNGKGTGDTETGAYTLLGGTPTPANAQSITRNPEARWWLPTENEWYKAAYYDPVTKLYFDYPTRSNEKPDNNLPSADSGNSSNYGLFEVTTGNPNFPMTDAGAYKTSTSPYGTLDQAGNVEEWNETSITGSIGGLRGASWRTGFKLHASKRGIGSPKAYYDDIGFRVATRIPEPSAMILLFIGVMQLLCRDAIRRK
jgi:formylglycine-generating enzyme required for sulfatase activity